MKELFLARVVQQDRDLAPMSDVQDDPEPSGEGHDESVPGTQRGKWHRLGLSHSAALTVIPMAIMGAYLLAARRLGAFEAL